MTTPAKYEQIDVNILIGTIPDSDRELFFGPLDGSETWIELPIEVKWPDIMAQSKVFSSKSQARKNGWDKEIKPGFSEITVGKLKHRITVLKEFI